MVSTDKAVPYLQKNSTGENLEVKLFNCHALRVRFPSEREHLKIMKRRAKVSTLCVNIKYKGRYE
ncbi:MAG: hypothetical protein AAFX80_23000, partial [Cyanobacteria bacterium J06639_18]